MVKEINNSLYCITSYTGLKRFVECETEEELAEYIAENELKGYSVTSVCKVCTDGSKPRIAIKANPVYKKKINELLKTKNK